MEDRIANNIAAREQLPDGGAPNAQISPGNQLSLKAYEELFRKYYKYLCLTAEAILKDNAAAEDLVQEFFIEYWNQQKHQLSGNDFRAYAKRAVSNDCFDQLRKQKVIEKNHQTIQHQEEENPEQLSEAEEIEREKYQTVLDLVAELPEARRQILVLHAIDQLTYAEIGAKQGVSINTVRTQLTRAYKTLRSHGSLVLITILMKF